MTNETAGSEDGSSGGMDMAKAIDVLDQIDRSDLQSAISEQSDIVEGTLSNLSKGQLVDQAFEVGFTEEDLEGLAANTTKSNSMTWSTNSGAIDAQNQQERVQKRKAIQQGLVRNLDTPWTNRDDFGTMSDEKLVQEAEKYNVDYETQSHNAEDEDLSGWENRAGKRIGEEIGPGQAQNSDSDLSNGRVRGGETNTQSENGDDEDLSGWANSPSMKEELREG